MSKKICLIHNYAQHYRKSIFEEMDKNFSIDFVFGDKYLDVKKLDYTILENFKKEVKNVTFIKKPIYYQRGVLHLLKENYSSYLFLGDTHCISTWIMLIFLYFSSKKSYLWTHGWYGRENCIKTLFNKLFYKLSDGIFLYGNYAKDLMIKEGINENKLHVVYNSLEYDYHLSLRKSLKGSDIYKNHFKNNYKNLIFIGRLTQTKKLHLLIESLKEISSSNNICNLTFIGDGECFIELMNLVDSHGLNNLVWFYGPCYDEKIISEFLYNADICVSPGNVGLTAIHSLMFGTPVITHSDFKNQMPEFEAITPGDSGLFFNLNEKGSLSKKIVEWLSSDVDREIIRQECFRVIDQKYNPHVQLKIFQSVLC